MKNNFQYISLLALVLALFGVGCVYFNFIEVTHIFGSNTKGQELFGNIIKLCFLISLGTFYLGGGSFHSKGNKKGSRAGKIFLGGFLALLGIYFVFMSVLFSTIVGGIFGIGLLYASYNIITAQTRDIKSKK